MEHNKYSAAAAAEISCSRMRRAGPRSARRPALRTVFLVGYATGRCAGVPMDPICGANGHSIEAVEEAGTLLLQVEMHVGATSRQAQQMHPIGQSELIADSTATTLTLTGATSSKDAAQGSSNSHSSSSGSSSSRKRGAGSETVGEAATSVADLTLAGVAGATRLDATEAQVIEAAGDGFRSKQHRVQFRQHRSGLDRLWNGVAVAQLKAHGVGDTIKVISGRLLKKVTDTRGLASQKTVFETMLLLLLLGFFMMTNFWKSLLWTVPRCLEGKPEEVVRRIAMEHGLGRKAPAKLREAATHVDLVTFELGPSSSRRFRWLPMLVILACGLPPALFFASGHIYYAMLGPAFWTVYCCHRWCLFMAVGCVVGLRKIRAYEKVDFYKMHQEDMQTENMMESSSNRGWVTSRNHVNMQDRWGEIMHFVIVPNYKEEIDVLRTSIRSFAASPMAKEQIGIVLAMEEREAGAKEKAATLTQEFQSSFKTIVTSFHPPDLEGESAGKMSNERWAGQQLINNELPRRGLKPEDVLITVADADSELHRSYFSALTYSFLRLASSKPGIEEGEHMYAIWQAPMFAYKNILKQPTVTRFSAWVTALHETSHLADPTAVACAYSTYSLSALLVSKVGGWDPDWVSEDFHMTAKCMLASGGRTKVRPIFLPIISTAPEGLTWWESVYERWLQAKRHALGFMELCYVADHLPRALASMRTAGRPMKEQLYCFWRCLLIFLTISVLHLNLVLLVIVGPFTSLILASVMRSHLALWPVYIFCAVAPLKMMIFTVMTAQDALLFEVAKPHIIAKESSLSIWWRSPSLYAASQMILFAAWTPFVVIPASVAEWLAAMNIFWSHHFTHEPASKGQATTVSSSGGVEGAPESS